jgi:hypothetical protein
VYTLQHAFGVGGNRTNHMKITFNKPAGEEWSFIAAGALDQPGNQTDFSQGNALSLHLYGAVSLLIKLRDINGNESADSGILPAGNATAWTTITWDISAINWHQCDRQHIKDVIIFVQPGSTGSGYCYLDDLTLGNAGTPPVNDTLAIIDTFDDNTFWMTANTCNAQWEPVDTSVFQFAMSSNYGGANPPYLKVDANKAAGKEWAYFTAGQFFDPGNRSDFSQEHQLSMNLYGITGDVQLLMKFRDRYGKESGDSGTLTVNCNQQWKNLTWDYSQINWGECDSHQIAAILFFVQPGGTGHTTFCLDNLEFGEGVAITPTPTPSATPVSNPYLVIDDFLDPRLRGDYSARSAKWVFSTHGQTAGEVDNTFAGANVPSLKVTYTKPAGEEWANFSACRLNQWENINDITIDHRLSLKVYGQVNFIFKFRDVNGNYSVDSPVLAATNPSGWTTVTWDYSALQWNQCDPHHVEAIFIFPQPGQTGNGTFYIRWMALGDGGYLAPAAGVIDNFDNDESVSHTASQQDAEWYCPNTQVMFSIVTGNPTPRMSLSINKTSADTYYAARGLTQLNGVSDLSSHSQLAYQGLSLMDGSQGVSFVDQNGNESAMITKYTGTVGDFGVMGGYFLYDYSNLQWGNCDRHHIAEIRFYPFPGLTKMGTALSIDDIRLTGPAMAQ